MKGILIVIGILVLLAGIYFGGKAIGVFDRVTEPDHIINSYEEYEEMYAACEKICDDLRVLDASEVDKTSGFSKEERIIAMEQNLNRWIREYNAKSRMITRNMWKSETLPHSLKRTDFNCASIQ